MSTISSKAINFITQKAREAKKTAQTGKSSSNPGSATSSKSFAGAKGSVSSKIKTGARATANAKTSGSSGADRTQTAQSRKAGTKTTSPSRNVATPPAPSQSDRRREALDKRSGNSETVASRLASLSANAILGQVKPASSAPAVPRNSSSTVWQAARDTILTTVDPNYTPPVDERADDNFFQRVNHSVTGGIRGGAGFLADGVRAGIHDYAQDVSKPTRFLGQGINGVAQLGGTVVGIALETTGFDGAADRTRNNFRKAGQSAESGVNWVADRSDDFIHGLGESAAGGVVGLASTVTDPVGAVKGVAQLVQDPTLLLEGYKQTAKEYGWAGALGHATGDVLTTVATGGGGGAAKGASAAGRISKWGSQGGRVAQTVGRVAGVAESGLATASRLGNEAALIRQGVREALPEVSTLSNLGRRASSVDGAASPVSLNVPSRPRAAASRVLRDIVEEFRGNDAESFARRAELARAAAPELHADIAGVRDRIAAIGGRDELQALVDSPELTELARKIDAQSSGRAPSQVGDVVLSGRENILNYLQENSESLSEYDFRNLTRGLFADSEASGPAFLTLLRPQDKVSRVFGRNADSAAGGYFGRPVDGNQSRRQHTAFSALPSGNDAVFGLELPVGGDQPALALVTRVGHQTGNAGFHSVAPGGNWQIQFLDSSPFYPTLKEISPNGLSRQVELPAGLEWFSPLPGASASAPRAVDFFPSGEALRTYLARLERVGSGTADVANTFVTPHDTRNSEG